MQDGANNAILSRADCFSAAHLCEVPRESAPTLDMNPISTGTIILSQQPVPGNVISEQL